MTWSPQPAVNFSGVDVRMIGVDDWPLWREMRLEALAEAPYAFGSTLAEWQGEGDTEMRWRVRLSTVRVNLVAYLNGKSAGMASGTATNQDGTIELISMWVAPFARGQGVGNSLVAAAIDFARGQGAGKIILDIVESNAYAMALYRRHQFVDAGPIDCTGSGVPSERRMVLDLRRSVTDLTDAIGKYPDYDAV